MEIEKNQLANILYLNHAERIAKTFIVGLSRSYLNGKLSPTRLPCYQTFRQALHDVCTMGKKTEKSRLLLRKATKNKKIGVALFYFSLLETEDLLVRRHSTLFVKNFIGGLHFLIRPLISEILIIMKMPGHRESMESALQCCVQVFTDPAMEGMNFSRIILHLIVVYCCNIHDLYVNELGAMMLLSALRSMAHQLSSYLREITQGLQYALIRADHLMEANHKNCQFFVITILACVRIVGVNEPASEFTTQLYQNSIIYLTQSIRYVAAFGKPADYAEIVDVFVLLLINEKIIGEKWHMVLMGCMTIIDTLSLPPKVRMKTLEAVGKAICKRTEMWALNDFCFHTILMLMGVLLNPPEYDLDAVHALEFDYMPTPISVAADVLHFISIKINEEMVSLIVLEVIFRTFDHSDFGQWEHRGVFLSLARIVKGCGEYLNMMQSNKLALLFRYGLGDESLHVRDAAVYALHKFFVYLGVKTVDWSKHVFPAMLQNLELFISDIMRGMSHHPWHVERMFAIMQMYCCFLDKDLSVYLPTLMNIIHSFLCEVRERRTVILTIKMLQKIVYFVGGDIIPYLNSLFSMLYFYIMYWDISFNNEVRPYIVDFLAYLLCASREVLDYDGPRIIALVFNMLQLQKTRTDLAEDCVAKLTEYSYLRSSIFNFFHRISHVMRDDMAKHLPKILDTLLGTILVAERLEDEFQTEVKLFYYKPEDVNDLAIEDSDPDCFLLSDGNEVEIGKLPFDWDSPVLIEEVLHAAIALKGLIKNCLRSIQPYLPQIYNTLGQTLSCDYVELRKHAACIMNTILKSTLEGEQQVDYEILKGYVMRLLVVLQQESNLDVWTLDIESLLLCLAVEESFFDPDECRHAYLVEGLTEMFDQFGPLQEGTEYVTTKAQIFSNIIDFIPTLSSACINSSFSNYFGAFLTLFEIRFKQTCFEGPTISNRKRAELYARLNENFLLMDGRNVTYFLRITCLFFKALDDAYYVVRENAVSGLVALVEHCHQQPIDAYKRIIKVLLKTSKRERVGNVLDNIVYALAVIIRRNLWQLPMHKLLPDILRLLPIRVKVGFNIVVVELIELLYREMPEVITPHVDGTFKFLALQIDKNTNNDLCPLRKKALALASSIYANHYETLRNVAICRGSMQAIVAACKNKALINMR